MTETEFRVQHSTLIEYYQYIEMRLKGICSAIHQDRLIEWYKHLDEYGEDSFGKLLIKVRTAQEQKQCFLLSDDDFRDLDRMRQARNYWCHQCFGGDAPLIIKNGFVKQSECIIRLVSDLNDAIEWDEKLANKLRTIVRT